MNNPQDIAVLEKLLNVLDNMNIAYVIGGSMASSTYGTARFTQDADITVEPFGPICDKFIEALKNDFYVSKEAMNQALQSKISFNIIHLATAFKIDIFVRPEKEFYRQMFSRSRKLKLGNIAKEVSFVSPEDIILLKLDWYRQSGCNSERQWTDVLGVLSIQKNSLDFDYLKNWAKKLGLNDLLQKAIMES
ncbi:MAG: hypothetical protein WC496_10345 [Phycisphaerae bacterium]